VYKLKLKIVVVENKIVGVIRSENVHATSCVHDAPTFYNIQANKLVIIILLIY